MVAGLVESTLVSVFFEFQQKTTIYRRKFAKRWRGLSQRTLDREIDASLRNQIAQQTLHVCERHFEKTQPKHVSYFLSLVGPKKKICGFPVSSYKNLGRVGRF